MTEKRAGYECGPPGVCVDEWPEIYEVDVEGKKYRTHLTESTAVWLTRVKTNLAQDNIAHFLVNLAKVPVSTKEEIAAAKQRVSVASHRYANGPEHLHQEDTYSWDGRPIFAVHLDAGPEGFKIYTTWNIDPLLPWEEPSQ
ncbi:hypothetical protein [Gallaecimonas sp. GXIMD4217]|uniref:hypothetical protein n=1 Tax=Gallaecimonas sp. GXIMD4217 TaxID=3131927 RepID=UPI00311B42A9